MPHSRRRRRPEHGSKEVGWRQEKRGLREGPECLTLVTDRIQVSSRCPCYSPLIATSLLHSLLLPLIVTIYSFLQFSTYTRVSHHNARQWSVSRKAPTMAVHTKHRLTSTPLFVPTDQASRRDCAMFKVAKLYQNTLPLRMHHAPTYASSHRWWPLLHKRGSEEAKSWSRAVIVTRKSSSCSSRGGLAPERMAQRHRQQARAVEAARRGPTRKETYGCSSTSTTDQSS